ncbi:rho GTPase-activating protein 40 isoform X1 [Latimeria chalumnae]|uniref:rho GTPase-activating protein 40 isoform X1 n=2 Tax=Latimeria chalumnae TaxID=7897 RepID=UPI00313DA2DE
MDSKSGKLTPPKMSQLPWKSSLEQLSECSSSKDSLDNLSIDDYWTEVENIKQSSDSELEENSSVDARSPDAGEVEAQWLQDAGLSTLICEQPEDIDNMVLLSTLTRTQADAVQRRVDTYTHSIRIKNKQPARDVRDVFGMARSGEGLREGPTEDVGQEYLNQNVVERNLDDISTMRNCGREEVFNIDVSYSEQAARLQKRLTLQNRGSQRLVESESLPTFIVPKNRLGAIKIGDLSLQDMKKVQTLALIELTALCDILGLELKRNKSVKRKASDGCLFGVPLTMLLENDQKIVPNTRVPLILQALMSTLEKKGLGNEGLLRISGSHTRIKCLQQKLESSFYARGFSWEEVHQNDVAGLLKRFLRELPCPLLTTEYLPAFISVQNIEHPKLKLQALNLLVLLLPEPNRNTLKALLEFLNKVAAREKYNKMNLWNISTIMAPNLFMHKGLPDKVTEGNPKEVAENAASVVQMLLSYQDLLWTIPSFLVMQVRKLMENSSRRYPFYDKRIKNLLKKMQTDKEKNEKSQLESSKVVKIQITPLLKDSMEIQLKDNTRVADVLRRFYEDLCQNNWGLVDAVNFIKW